MVQQGYSETKQQISRILRQFVAKHEGSAMQEVLKIVHDLAESEKNQTTTQTKMYKEERRTKGRWAKFAERIHKESPLRGISKHVQFSFRH
jgi:hypothetical protein